MAMLPTVGKVCMLGRVRVIKNSYFLSESSHLMAFRAEIYGLVTIMVCIRRTTRGMGRKQKDILQNIKFNMRN